MAGKAKKDGEIEISPEMIEAGVRAMAEYDSRFESLTDAVREVYTAMESVKAS